VDVGDDAHFQSAFSVEDSPVALIPSACPVCAREGANRSCTLNIPHFKEIILMAFNCEFCGYHSGEVMVGGGVSPRARKVTVTCRTPRDLEREVLKSESAAVEIPECGLQCLPGTLGGKFSTVEGLIQDVQKHLEERNPFMSGDSSSLERDPTFMHLITNLHTYLKGEAPFTLIIDDPMANSYVQVWGDDDTQVKIEDYDRSEEQNESLGLNDMRTAEFETFDDGEPAPAE
jgi:zinc finger protein